MHCRTCATQVADSKEPCSVCGVRPLVGRAYCSNCGKDTPNPDQEICLTCGVRVRPVPAGAGFGDVSDVLYRVSGGIMMMSGLWNMLWSFLLFISLIWVCVGVFWIIPGVLSLVYVAAGIAAIATGNKVKPLAFVPGLGMVISVMNFNILGFGLDVLALVLGVVAFSQAPPADEAVIVPV